MPGAPSVVEDVPPHALTDTACRNARCPEGVPNQRLGDGGAGTSKSPLLRAETAVELGVRAWFGNWKTGKAERHAWYTIKGLVAEVLPPRQPVRFEAPPGGVLSLPRRVARAGIALAARGPVGQGREIALGRAGWDRAGVQRAARPARKGGWPKTHLEHEIGRAHV